jgi:hypothetical protein
MDLWLLASVALGVLLIGRLICLPWSLLYRQDNSHVKLPLDLRIIEGLLMAILAVAFVIEIAALFTIMFFARPIPMGIRSTAVNLGDKALFLAFVPLALAIWIVRYQPIETAIAAFFIWFVFFTV